MCHIRKTHYHDDSDVDGALIVKELIVILCVTSKAENLQVVLIL